MNSIDDEAMMRRALVDHYARVCELRLNELASGNMSCRFRDGMLISPTGASSETITEQSIVFVDSAGNWQGDHRPSTEWLMHTEIYRQYPDAHAVVHTHSDYCVAVASHNRSLPGFHYLIGVFGGTDVPCVPYSTFGGKSLAENATAALKDRSACLLGNHGMICRGPNLGSAVKIAHRLEIMCRQYTLSRQLGEPSCLTAEDWQEFFAKVRSIRYG